MAICTLKYYDASWLNCSDNLITQCGLIPGFCSVIHKSEPHVTLAQASWVWEIIATMSKKKWLKRCLNSALGGAQQASDCSDSGCELKCCPARPQVIFDRKFVLCVQQQTVTDPYLSQDELLRLDSCWASSRIFSMSPLWIEDDEGTCSRPPTIASSSSTWGRGSRPAAGPVVEVDWTDPAVPLFISNSTQEPEPDQQKKSLLLNA